MIKIAVFGCGWGGELFADYLKQELAVVEIIKINDYAHAPYGELEWSRICELTERAVQAWIGRAELIVLASCAATVAAINYLREKYPEQTFVGFEPRLSEGLGKLEPRRVMLVASRPVQKSIGYKVEREQLALTAEIIEPDCLAWLKYADQEEMTARRLKKSLAEQGIVRSDEVAQQIDAVIIYESSLSDLREVFEAVVGWQTVVINGFRPLYRKICGSLGLVGLDGNERSRLK